MLPLELLAPFRCDRYPPQEFSEHSPSLLTANLRRRGRAAASCPLLLQRHQRLQDPPKSVDIFLWLRLRREPQPTPAILSSCTFCLWPAPGAFHLPVMSGAHASRSPLLLWLQKR